jgi:diguanylate cyclase (GGDEF)-like protein
LLGSSLTPLQVQWTAWIGNGLALLACLLMLLLDSRSYRWAPLLTLLAAAVAVVVRVLADHQVLPPTLLNLYGWQPLLAVTVALYLALPWIRARLQRWAVRKRAEPPEPSAAEKIEQARARLLDSLQAGLKSAADGDLKWIAFRRLLDGLRPVLSQTSAAVVAMHFHGEDLMQVEPPEAEGRYRELLAQRTTLLKNLSRLRAPQQIGIDFDGPAGPLEQVQLAVIPLPIPKPGWGALLVERQADVTYSDAELALCAEFAAMAIMAGEEAAGAVNAQKTAETDPATGVLRADAILQRLDKHMETARLKQAPLSVLCLQLDQVAALRGASGEVGATAGLRPVAELLLEAAEYGDLLGRSGPDGFLLVVPGKRLLQAREYAERLRAAVSRLRIDPRIATSLSLSVGVAQAGPDERSPAGILERATRAAQIASKNGGNQIFS